jgi:hypothetical protein
MVRDAQGHYNVASPDQILAAARAIIAEAPSAPGAGPRVSRAGPSGAGRRKAVRPSQAGSRDDRASQKDPETGIRNRAQDLRRGFGHSKEKEQSMRTAPSQPSETADQFADMGRLWDPVLLDWIAKSQACLWSPALRAAAEAARKAPTEDRLPIETALVSAQDANPPAEPSDRDEVTFAFTALRLRTEDRIARLLAKTVEALIPASPACRNPVQPPEIREACNTARRYLDLFPTPRGAEPMPRHQIVKAALGTLAAVLDHTLAAPAPDAEVWADIKTMARDASLQQIKLRAIPKFGPCVG